MLYDLFLEVIVNKLKQESPEEWKDAKLSIRTAEKINQPRKGICFERESKISPTIYMEEFFEMQQKGEDMDTIAQSIYEILNGLEEIPFEKYDFEYLKNNKDKIIFELIHTEENKALLAERPHREFQDLSIIYTWVLDMDSEGVSTLPITDALSDIFKLPEEKLYEMALENTKRLLPIVVKPMSQIVKELMENLPADYETMFRVDKDEQLHVLTNTKRKLGATVMLYPEVIHEIAEALGEDLYIIPSSRNEVLAIKQSEVELEQIADVVYSVNMSELETEDILSHQVYQYDMKTRGISMATKLPHRSFLNEETQRKRIEKKDRSTSR